MYIINKNGINVNKIYVLRIFSICILFKRLLAKNYILGSVYQNGQYSDEIFISYSPSRMIIVYQSNLF